MRGKKGQKLTGVECLLPRVVREQKKYIYSPMSAPETLRQVPQVFKDIYISDSCFKSLIHVLNYYIYMYYTVYIFYYIQNNEIYFILHFYIFNYILFYHFITIILFLFF